MMTEASAEITPLILTYNEQPNIGRTLDTLQWARRVVVLDSGSTDDTRHIVNAYPNTDFITHSFDTHARQWEYGVRETGIEKGFVLALDADMSLTPEFVSELRTGFVRQEYDGGITPFEFAVHGQKLKGSIYPSQLRVFKPSVVRVWQNGHTQEFSTDSPRIYRFQAKLIHDDRKPLERWVASQLAYSKLELQRFEQQSTNHSRGRLQDRLRRAGLMPLISGLLAYLRAGGPFRGAAAAHYAYERATFETLLALRVMREKLEKHNHDESRFK